MAWQDGRSRSVQKIVTFTPQEWDHVRADMRKYGWSGSRSWNAYARFAVMHQQVVEVQVPFDAREMEKAVNKIGMNINQIAHKVNLVDSVTQEDVRLLRKQIADIRAVIDSCWGEYYRQIEVNGRGLRKN